MILHIPENLKKKLNRHIPYASFMRYIAEVIVRLEKRDEEITPKVWNDEIHNAFLLVLAEILSFVAEELKFDEKNLEQIDDFNQLILSTLRKYYPIQLELK